MGSRQVLRSDSGTVTVEFFLVLPLVILVLVAGIQVISIARARIELVGAVREGARVAATSPDPARAVQAVQDALNPSVRNQVRVSVSRPAVVGRPARVSASLRHALFGSVLDGPSVNLTARASMLVER